MTVRYSAIVCPHAGQMLNGKIGIISASSNLILSVQTMAGGVPSPATPVSVRIGNTLRQITAALSVTKAAGTNWANLGGSELATLEHDLFAYLIWNTNINAVDIFWSRIPSGTLYSDFSTTNTNEKYAAINATAPASTDECVLIGRFAAILSGGAGYTWSVPTFTAINLIQRPIYETRYLSWAPVYSASGSMTYTGVTTHIATYKITSDKLDAWVRATGTTGGVASSAINATLPFNARNVALFPPVLSQVVDGTSMAGRGSVGGGTPNIIAVNKYDGSNWALAAGKIISVQAVYQI